MLNPFPDTQESLLLIAFLIPLKALPHRTDCRISQPLPSLSQASSRFWEEQPFGQLSLWAARGTLGGNAIGSDFQCLHCSGQNCRELWFQEEWKHQNHVNAQVINNTSLRNNSPGAVLLVTTGYIWIWINKGGRITLWSSYKGKNTFGCGMFLQLYNFNQRGQKAIKKWRNPGKEVVSTGKTHTWYKPCRGGAPTSHSLPEYMEMKPISEHQRRIPPQKSWFSWSSVDLSVSGLSEVFRDTISDQSWVREDTLP